MVIYCIFRSPRKKRESATQWYKKYGHFHRANSEPSVSEREEGKMFSLVTTKLKMFFGRGNSSQNSSTCDSPKNTKPPLTQREQAYKVCNEWIEKSAGRYRIVTHLDDIGWRPYKNWFLIKDTTTYQDRLISWVILPADCVSLEQLKHFDSSNINNVLRKVIDKLQHPYIYPILDLDVFSFNESKYMCIVVPTDIRGSLKDAIYHVNWNFILNLLLTRNCLNIRLSILSYEKIVDALG